MQPSVHGHRLDRLDHLRAFAAILVLLWHGAAVRTGATPGLYAIAREGHAGVSLFCVISGLILTYIYLHKPVKYGDFIRKRLLRIGPMLVVYTMLAYYTSELSLTDLAGIFTTTTKFGRGLAVFNPQDWTLLVEIQFYLIFPFLIVFTRNSGIRYLLGLLALMIIFRTCVYYAFGSVQPQAYWTIFGRMDQFLLGMVAGILLRDGWIETLTRKRLAALAGLLGTVLIFGFYAWWRKAMGGLLADLGPAWSTRNLIWVLIPTIEAVGFALMAVGYVCAPVGAVVAPLRWLSAGFAFLGRISYSLYMNQFMALIWLRAWHQKFGEQASWGAGARETLFVILPALAALSTLTYYLIEKPFLNLKDKA
jgi:peptidoglycan/LPS O-acetylase OafA/YrhL